MYKMNRKSHKRLAPVHGFLAAAVLGLAVMPIAFAGAAPTASTSGALTAAKFKKLKQRVAALEANGGGGVSPTGPAGGDLAGNYPTPTIRANAIDSANIQDGTVTGADILNDTLTVDDIGPNSVGSSEIVIDNVGTEEIAADTVGGSELKAPVAKFGDGVDVPANTNKIASVTCPVDSILLAGGYAWQNEVAGTTINASAPSESNPDRIWIVSARATAANRLFAWATCMPV